MLLSIILKVFFGRKYRFSEMTEMLLYVGQLIYFIISQRTVSLDLFRSFLIQNEFNYFHTSSLK